VTRAFAAMLLVMLLRPAWAQPADTKAQAVAAASEGATRFQDYDYVGAVERFKAAYELDPDPGYLFNIAQAYRLSGDCANAADYYGHFLEKVPDPPNAERVKRWSAEQRACANARTQHAETKVVEPPHPDVVIKPPAAVPVPEVDHPGRNQRGVAITLAGVGAVAFGVAGFFTWDGNYLDSQKSSLLLRCTEAAPCSSATVNDYDRRGSRANTIAVSGYVVGGAALAGGIVLFLTARSSAETPVVIAPTRGGAMIFRGFAF
jgi:tetratricopeptide (TPR) repeat protein